MPLELGQFAVMDYLWDQLEKTKDGKHIRYTLLDIEMLWKMGFVDTERFSMEEWKQALEPFRQADGSFILDKPRFLALDHYRYKGEIHIPFDAMRINEGLYTDEGLQQLVDSSIAPSSNMPPEKLEAFFEALKETFRTPDGLIRIDVHAKKQIRDIIEKNPSPLRNLEILFDQMLRKGKDKDISEKIEGAEAEVATARAAIEASTFSAAPRTRSEAAAKTLKRIQKAKTAETPETPSEGGVHLKKIRRSRKGMRG